MRQQGEKAAHAECRPLLQDSGGWQCPGQSRVPAPTPAEPGTQGWHCGILAFSYQGASLENAENPSEIIFQCIHKLSEGTFDWMGIYI